MDYRNLCTLVVRSFGLWIIVSWFSGVVWPLVDLARLATGDQPPQYAPLSFWDFLKHVPNVLVFAFGGWLFLDGRQVIDQFQYAPPMPRSPAPSVPPSSGSE